MAILDSVRFLAGYSHHELLGRGTFGNVLRVFTKKKSCVVMKFNYRQNREKETQREVEMLKLVQGHFGCVTIKDCIKLLDATVIVFENFALYTSDLQNFLFSKELNLKIKLARRKFQSLNKLELFEKIIEIVESYRALKLYHCDLKVENFIIDLDALIEFGMFRLQLVDFGGAAFGYEKFSYQSRTMVHLPNDIDVKDSNVYDDCEMYALACTLSDVLKYGDLCYCYRDLFNYIHIIMLAEYKKDRPTLREAIDNCKQIIENTKKEMSVKSTFPRMSIRSNSC